MMIKREKLKVKGAGGKHDDWQSLAFFCQDFRCVQSVIETF